MSTKKTLGGDRVGSGAEMQVELKNYERSTHDKGYVFRTTQAPGTLVPFIYELALNGDSIDIDLNADTMTHPTIGPLFGSFKQQMDVYVIPIRNYQGLLTMNATEVGMNMKDIKFPQLTLRGKKLDTTKPLDNQHTNPSSILAYLGIRGCGNNNHDSGFPMMERNFNALGYLAYYDIYKQYYANKQEKIGAIVATTPGSIVGNIQSIGIIWDNGNKNAVIDNVAGDAGFYLDAGSVAEVQMTDPGTVTLDPSRIYINTIEWGQIALTDMFDNNYVNGDQIIFKSPVSTWIGRSITANTFYVNRTEGLDTEPQIVTFDLKNIDEMRKRILRATDDGVPPFNINDQALLPYSAPLDVYVEEGEIIYSGSLGNQQGLALKTYQSDLFNNWLDTEWISGSNGINEITAISTADGKITIDEINMANKVYNVLNRIAVSGGTYEDWQEAVYGEKAQLKGTSPMYMGGLIKEVVFQEVVSTAAGQAEQQPLGTLAGRGTFSKKHKGGKVRIKVTEPSIIIALNSLTPRIDYSQGNDWLGNIKTMDDLHKPGLDQIGFQDLITDQMAWWDTQVSAGGEGAADFTFYSAGKQPAWLNYMTNVNRVLGNFADETQQMFMTLNRRYESEFLADGATLRIKDLTTYIDPSKYNYIFADVRRDAQNFWVQIGVNMTFRRKMSAKVMPNL